MNAMEWIWVIPVVGSLLALLCLWRAHVAGRRFLLIQNLPTSKTSGVFIGLVEVKGTAETEEPLISYLAETSCVYYQWTVQERWSRTVRETYRDSNGRTQTRTRRESGWTQVASGGQEVPFYLMDDHGAIRVQPKGAKIEPTTVFSQKCSLRDPLYYEKGPSGGVMNSDGVRDFTEVAIPQHAPLYVVGQARERADVVAAEIAVDAAAPLFLISTRTEEKVTRSYRIWRWGWMILGLLLVLAGLVADSLIRGEQPDRGELLTGAAVYLGCVVLGWGILVYNGLIDLRQRVNRAWAQVEVQLKRRYDLIPRLVEIVQAARGYEQEVQTDLAELRTQLSATAPGAPGVDHHAVTATVTMLAERYPDLKANTAFLNLQENLADTENRIALARGYFNEIATYYNTRIEVIPDKMVASLAGMHPRATMVADEFERASVEVNYTA